MWEWMLADMGVNASGRSSECLASGRKKRWWPAVAGGREASFFDGFENLNLVSAARTGAIFSILLPESWFNQSLQNINCVVLYTDLSLGHCLATVLMSLATIISVTGYKPVKSHAHTIISPFISHVLGYTSDLGLLTMILYLQQDLTIT